MTTRRRARQFYWHWHVEIGLVVLFAGIALLAANAFSQRADLRHEARRGSQAYAAVCEYRRDLVDREKTAQAFLRAHPNGAFGLTAAQLQQSLTNEERAIFSLRSLQC